ncbi:hypothetical protein ACFS5L_19695 [Streptomyces phyllanthi]|uniref:Uncharacterized protein n=1 Tax=Streptomyces phyllanthi TaxID=1803180 RepID=A0A5N8WBV6_9ACTN|nr:hypothetical protein [Streptomyces phyllanthi]MPY44963.1 hypothetical protein [Streptomyces phyllanthi]
MTRPGKLHVGERARFGAYDTQAWGSGGICGDATGKVDTECTQAQLEKAAKTGNATVTVTIRKDGTASEIREQ